MEKFVTALGESFKEKNPNVTVEAQFTGSSAGISSVLNGKADIGDSSRALTDEEKSQGLEENIVAIDGIAVAVNKDNTVKNVTKEQLTKIYTGEITNWKELGGKDEKIVVIGREAGEGVGVEGGGVGHRSAVEGDVAAREGRVGKSEHQSW